MRRLLNNLLNIRPSEWPRLALLCTMLFLMSAGSIWGLGIIEALFLKQVGVAFLPWIIVASALAFVLVLALYTAFADRVANDTLLIAILVAGAAGLAIGRVLVALDLSVVAYPLTYVLALVLIDIFNLHWTTYVLGFYDAQAAKRLIPVVIAAARIAVIAAGLSMPVLTWLLAPSDIVVVWFGTIVLIAFLAWKMPALLGEDRAAAAPRPGMPSPSIPHTSYVTNIRDGYRYVVQSVFLRWMAFSTLLLMVLVALLNYNASNIFQIQLGSAANIANVVGLLSAAANLILTPFLLFGFSRLISRIGVGNANLIYPLGNLAVCGMLIAAPSLPAAALAYVDRTSFRVAFNSTLDGLLYSAVPLRMKGRARAFISGLVVPVGSLIGGGLLLLLPLLSATWLLSALIGALALAYLGGSLMIRRHYARALIKLLEQEDFSFLLSQETSELKLSDARALASLRQKLAESSSYEFTVFMARLISQVGAEGAVPILEQAARAAADARTRLALLDILIAAEARGDQVRKLYADLLADAEPRVRQVALAGLEQLLGAKSDLFLSLALPLIHDPDIEVRSQALPALARSGHFHYLAPCIELLDELLASADPQQRARAIRVLGQLDDVHIVRSLVRHLADPADEVRLEVVAAIEELWHGPLEPWITALVLSRMRDLVHDPIQHVREATLKLLGRIGARQSYVVLVGALTDSSPEIRATAVDALVLAGQPIVPALQPSLHAAEPQLRKMATVILSRVDHNTFGALVEAEILGSLELIYRNLGRLEALALCEGYRSVRVLQSALREQNRQHIDEIFYLLTSGGKQGAPRVIIESLRSPDPRVRANAVEALESLATPQIARLVTLLFDPAAAPATLIKIGEATWNISCLDTPSAIRQLLVDKADPWLRTITTFALGEMGAALAPKSNGKLPAADSPPPTADGKSDRRARRPRLSDLVSALDDSASQLAASPAAPIQGLLTLPEIKALLQNMHADPAAEVSATALTAEQLLRGSRIADLTTQEGTIVLSTIEKILFLKEVPFFQGMTIDQLKVLATVCEERLFAADTRIFNQGDPGGTLYVVVSGQVAIEQEKQRKGSFARLALIEANSYFGEMNLFDDSPLSTTAMTLQDTLALCLRREPLIVLARQHPDLSLELIKVLSQRLREANDRVADLTRTKPRELHKLYDHFAETQDP